jgi:hypothetical protein
VTASNNGRHTHEYRLNATDSFSPASQGPADFLPPADLAAFGDAICESGKNCIIRAASAPKSEVLLAPVAPAALQVIVHHLQGQHQDNRQAAETSASLQDDDHAWQLCWEATSVSSSKHDIVQFALTPAAAYNVRYKAGQLLWDAQAARTIEPATCGTPKATVHTQLQR